MEFLLGDTLTERYGQILASTFNGDLQGLKDIIEDATKNEFVRSAPLHAYGYLCKLGVFKQEEFVIM